MQCGDKNKRPTSPSRRRQRNDFHRRRPTEIIIKIISATYGPCEECDYGDSDDATIPLTRDCARFIREMLAVALKREERDLENEHRHFPEQSEQQHQQDKCNHVVRVPPTVDGKIQCFIYLLPLPSLSGRKMITPTLGRKEREFVSMNAVFGDPCPGTSKRLEISYKVTEVFTSSDSPTLRTSSSPPRTEIHRASFAEHETVKLRRCLTTMNTTTTLTEDEDDAPENSTSSCSSSDQIPWKLQPETSEIILPIVLPLLNLWERMQCRLICRCWKKIVQECGVSQTIDVNDKSMIKIIRTTNTGETNNNNNNNSFTRSILRGLLAYSYSSLRSLFLSGFEELQKEDLHSAIPYLKNLYALDVSRCHHLDDSTLQLLARPGVPASSTLRVLYLKSVRRISDVGLKAICHSNKKLEVLDLSQLTSITDEGGRCIQQLTRLRALFLRDNWRLTNESLDAITTTCVKLEQLTLWGCVRLRHLKFDSGNDINTTNTSDRLVILNLWGIHDLQDDAAHALSNLPNLNSLIVSECHRLTDRFVQTFAEGMKQRYLQHFDLRYLKRITDTAIVAIALNLRDLFSLDLTFCNKLTAEGIYRLLDELRDSLVELRLKSCRSLQIGTPQHEVINEQRRMIGQQRNNNHDHAGHWILNALRRPPHCKTDHSLCLLDVRECGGQPATALPYPENDPFVKGMSALNFEQRVPGFFRRNTKKI
ncbi:MAG: hypothetical protein ACI90V_013343 [Bacillariaceae sp.]|jgi:hypothetical protein